MNKPPAFELVHPMAAEELVAFLNHGKDPATMTHWVDLVKVGRNDPCPCGSGKKFKKCCI